MIAELQELLADRADDKSLWASIKAVYSALIVDRQDWELAETFHNSITRKVFVTVGVDDRIEFVDTDFGSPPTPALSAVYADYQSDGGVTQLVETIVTKHFDRQTFVDLTGDAEEAAERIGFCPGCKGWGWSTRTEWRWSSPFSTGARLPTSSDFSTRARYGYPWSSGSATDRRVSGSMSCS